MRACARCVRACVRVFVCGNCMLEGQANGARALCIFVGASEYVCGKVRIRVCACMYMYESVRVCMCWSVQRVRVCMCESVDWS